MFILFSVDGYKITYHNLNQTLISVKDVSYQRTFLQHLHFFHQIQIELDKLAYVFEQDQQWKKKNRRENPMSRFCCMFQQEKNTQRQNALYCKINRQYKCKSFEFAFSSFFCEIQCMVKSIVILQMFLFSRHFFRIMCVFPISPHTHRHTSIIYTHTAKPRNENTNM